MREWVKTALFAVAAILLAVAAAVREPESATPEILSDQGEIFYPKFTDPQAPKTIEVIDYDEATATARPFKVAFRRGRWVIVTHHDYPVDAGDRLAKTAAALVDLRKDLVISDSAEEHARLGVIDPLDQNVASLTGRGKRVTLRDERGEVLADFILGKPAEGKPGHRYVRAPGSKRTYAVKTEADPSANFADWVDAGLLQIASASIRKVTIVHYSIDESLGRLANMDTVVLTQQGGKWSMSDSGKLNEGAARAMASALNGLKIVDVRPKPPAMARDLRDGQIQLTLESALSLRQRGFFVSSTGRIFANEGEMMVETDKGLVYSLRFGEVAATAADGKAAEGGGENRHLFVTVRFDPALAAKHGGDASSGERLAKSLNNRFADWYYVIRGEDFRRLRLKRQDLVR